MKKALMLVAAVSMAAAPLFAIDTTVEGNVSATFGADLNTGYTGFENSADVKVKVDLIKKGTDIDNNEEEGIYGSIEIKDVSLSLINGLNKVADTDSKTKDTLSGTVTGKLHFGDAFIGVYNKPDIDKNFAENFGYKKGDARQGSDFNIDSEYLNATAGMSAGYDNGDISVELSVASVGDWDNDTKASVAEDKGTWSTGITKKVTAVTDAKTNTKNQYIFGLDASAEFGGFSVDAALLFANKAENLINDKHFFGFAVKPGFEMDFTDKLGMEIEVGVDGVVIPKDGIAANAEGLYMDFAPKLVFNLTAANDDDDRSNIELKAYTRVMTAEALKNDKLNLNLQAKLTEQKDGGFVDGFGGSLTFKILDIAQDTRSWDLDGDVKYEVIAGLTPSLGAGYGTDKKFNLEGGVELGSDLHTIKNTTFNINYKSGNLTEATIDKGILTFKTKISF